MSNSKPATFSAVILNYNHSQYLLNTLNAAIHQTVPFDEIIVIDDASTDQSAALIQERIREVPHARLIRNPRNLGVIRAGNIGLKEAAGDFICYMSADDGYSPHIVEWCRAALQQYPHVAMISGNTCICNTATGKDRAFTLPFPQEIGCYSRTDIETIAKRRAFTFNIGANVIRRDAILAAGELIPSLQWHSDWFLYLLIARRAPFAVAPHTFARVRQAGDQYSHACFNWATQRPVIEAFIHTLKNGDPEDYAFFRRCSLLPTYDVEALFLFLKDKSLRHYLTPLLCWRLLSYKGLRALSTLCPDKARAGMRAFLRV